MQLLKSTFNRQWKSNSKFLIQVFKRCSLQRKYIFVVVSKIRVFVFPGPRTSAWPQALVPNLYLPALAPNFYIPALPSPKPGLAYTNHVPPVCIHWSWPTICITVLWICIYFFICSHSSGSSNISNSSNFFGLDNTNIRMPIVVN